MLILVTDYHGEVFEVENDTVLCFLNNETLFGAFTSSGRRRDKLNGFRGRTFITLLYAVGVPCQRAGTQDRGWRSQQQTLAPHESEKIREFVSSNTNVISEASTCRRSNVEPFHQHGTRLRVVALLERFRDQGIERICRSDLRHGMTSVSWISRFVDASSACTLREEGYWLQRKQRVAERCYAQH